MQRYRLLLLPVEENCYRIDDEIDEVAQVKVCLQLLICIDYLSCIVHA